jgi:thiamine pyrophosphate-dependent acetolactate synthase large subunit-like protein
VTEADILYELTNFWVARGPNGYEVLEYRATHSVVVGTFGYGLPNALGRAIAECDRRQVLADKAT